MATTGTPPQQSQTAPTIYDVARRAGVSATTVSYVLAGRRNGAARISEATRDRVLAAIVDLGYVPNDTARSLRRRRTDRICLVLPRLGSPYLEVLATCLQRAGTERGYSTIVTIGADADGVIAALGQLQRGLADGAIIHPAGAPPEAFVPLVDAGLPFVVLDEAAPPHGFDVVRTNERDACFAAVSYLLDRGHRRISFLGHEDDHLARETRGEAYRSALAAKGIAPNPALITGGASDRASAYHSASALLRLPEPPTAIFSASDIGAISAIWAVRDAGLRVPEDVAVLGVGNIPEGAVIRPGLTTTGPPSTDFSDVADLLFSRLAGTAPKEGRILNRPWTLIRRGSA